MKPILAALLGASALVTAAAPVLAQPPRAVSPAVMPGRDFREQLQTLQDRLDAGVRDRTVDRGEYDRAIRELNRIRDDIRERWADRRMDEGDRAQIQRRIDDLARSIHWMRVNDHTGDRDHMGDRDHLGPLPAQGPGGFSLDQREDWLQQRIERARSDGSLDRRTAWRTQQMLNGVRRDQARLVRRDRGVLTERDRTYLEQRLDRIRDTLRASRDGAERSPW